MVKFSLKKLLDLSWWTRAKPSIGSKEQSGRKYVQKEELQQLGVGFYSRLYVYGISENCGFVNSLQGFKAEECQAAFPFHEGHLEKLQKLGRKGIQWGK